MRFASIVGTRPPFIKLAPVSRSLRQQHQELTIHTGQHYDYCMSERFSDELDIPTPDSQPGVGSGSHGVQTERMLKAFEHALRLDSVIVCGDTNATLAGALAAAKLNIPVAHVEAGPGSFNRAMPEEINRVVTDHLSDRLFCPTETARRHANNEGITKGVDVVGDVMYDILLQVLPKIDAHIEPLSPVLGVVPQAYVLVRVHRAAITDEPGTMHRIAQALNKLELPVIFPIHPRTRACLERYGTVWQKYVQLIEPVGYVDMLAPERPAHRILTDSGGMQKEAFLLDVPCITLREDTEWMETIEAGWNMLVGSNWEAMEEAVHLPRSSGPQQNPFGQGDAAIHIGDSFTEARVIH